MKESMSINVSVVMAYVLGNLSSDVDRIIKKKLIQFFSSFSLKKTKKFNLLLQWNQACLLPTCDFIL